MELKDSGHRKQFQTGSHRDSPEGKGKFSLLQFLSLVKVAQICEAGAKKYVARNWELGQPLSQYLDSGLRHIIKFTLNFQDEDHLSQAIWNFLCLQETQMRIKAGLLPSELNDIPSDFFKGQDMSTVFPDLFSDTKKFESEKSL